MRREQIFLLLVLCSTMVSLAYLLWGIWLRPLLRKRYKQEMVHNRMGYVMKFIVMLLCPVIGPLFFAVGQLIYFALFQQDVDLEDVIFSKERVVTHLHADEDRDRNMVPLEEAIAISDKKSLRTLMFNIIKGDIQKSLPAIALALNSEDSETSHYAAAVLRDELNDFRVNVQKLYMEIKNEDSSQTECENVLIPYMNQVLDQRVFTDMEQDSLVRLFASVGEILYQKDPGQMKSEYFEWISLRLLEVKEFQAVEEWCQRALVQYPMELSTYTCQLKLYFTTQEKTKFFEVMEHLKQSSIIIDRETLELIRIFS